MFRVLSEEEARKVTRWKAPELATHAGHVAATRTEVLSRLATDSERMQRDGSKAERLARAAESHTSAPALQSGLTLPNMPMAEISAASSSPVNAESANKAPTTSVPSPHPSADMLQTSYDEGYTRGYEEGRTSGLQEGHAQGVAEGNADLNQQSVRQLQTVIGELQDSGTDILNDSVESELLKMSLTIASMVIHAELKTNPEAIVGVVRAGLEQLSESTTTQRKVHLHPLDAQLVRQAMMNEELLDIVEDASLEQGDCIVESKSSTVHAGVDDWLQMAAATFGLSTARDEAESN